MGVIEVFKVFCVVSDYDYLLLCFDFVLYKEMLFIILFYFLNVMKWIVSFDDVVCFFVVI